jgi:hypothetical protein
VLHATLDVLEHQVDRLLGDIVGDVANPRVSSIIPKKRSPSVG